MLDDLGTEPVPTKVDGGAFDPVALIDVRRHLGDEPDPAARHQEAAQRGALGIRVTHPEDVDVDREGLQGRSLGRDLHPRFAWTCEGTPRPGGPQRAKRGGKTNLSSLASVPERELRSRLSRLGQGSMSPRGPVRMSMPSCWMCTTTLKYVRLVNLTDQFPLGQTSREFGVGGGGNVTVNVI